jgi:hypothetical protein
LHTHKGSLIWSGAEDGYTDSMNTIVQKYRGEDVLTFFSGEFYAAGYGVGHWNLLSSNYSLVRQVSTINSTSNATDNAADFHEFFLTENNTALVEAWRLTETDLTPSNGTGTGWTFDCVFQEVDISGETDKLMFEWSALAHMNTGESYFTVQGDGNSSSNPFDWCHINSLEKISATGNWLVSLRGPSTLYYIDGQNGDILWRLGGKNSNFTMGTNATL